jgi:hypothetical protein
MGNKYKKFRHDDVDFEDEKPANHLPKDREAERKRKFAEEFWSDPCWSESERPVTLRRN